ncbi:hypothetical protein HaLaN_12152, partial [Haematococcus lacustris]
AALGLDFGTSDCAVTSRGAIRIRVSTSNRAERL